MNGMTSDLSLTQNLFSSERVDAVPRLRCGSPDPGSGEPAVTSRTDWS